MLLTKGYGYGTITLTWGRFLRYIQLQLQLSDFNGFAVFFRILMIAGRFLGGSRSCSCYPCQCRILVLFLLA
jgi:hypothetical protein